MSEPIEAPVATTATPILEASETPILEHDTVEVKPVETAVEQAEILANDESEVTAEDEAKPQHNDPYVPEFIVLAKVKGYPPWPAMVLDEDILPANIKNKKPKGPRSPKKKGTASRTVPVRFFSDDTYIWINSNDIKPLSKDDIEAHFIESSGKRRKDNLLENAFSLARDPPEMTQFVKWGSHPPSDDYYFEDEEELEEQPKQKKVALPKVNKTEQNRILAEERREAEIKLLAEYDSDWGVESNEYDTELGDYIFDTLEEQSKILSTTKYVDIQEKLYKYQTEFDGISNKLFPLLLSSEYSPKTVVTLLNQLTKLVPEAPKSVFLKSQLLRILIVTARKRGDNKVKKEIRKLLKNLGLDVEENAEEPVVVLEELNEESKEEEPTKKEVVNEELAAEPPTEEPTKKEEVKEEHAISV